MIDSFERSRSARIFVALPWRSRRGGRLVAEERPQPLADVRGSTPSRYSSAVPRRARSSVCRPRNAICSGTVGSTSDSSVKTCARLCPARSFRNSSTKRLSVHLVEQPVALPHRPADRHLAPDHVEDALHVDADERASLDDGRQRAAALEPDLEPQVVEAEQQAVDRALRDADREHARQPAADGERLVGIEQRVDQLADALLGHLPQRADRVLGHRIPREQRNHVRHERRRQAVALAQHRTDAVASRATAAPGSPAPRGRRSAARPGSRTAPAERPAAGDRPLGLQRPEHRRARRQVGDVPEIELDRAVEQAALERVDVAAVQPPGREQGDARADDGGERGAAGTARRTAPAAGRRPGRRRPRRRGDRSRRR